MTGMTTTPKFTAMADYLNLRSEPQRLQLDLPLRPVDPESAPVAALVPAHGYFQPRPGERDVQIRVLGGRLYQQPRTNNGQPAVPGSDWAEILVRSHFGTAKTVEAAEQLIFEGISRLITIDGEIWQQIDEPVLMVDHLGYDIKVRDEAPAGTAVWQVFTLTEVEAAEATAVKRIGYSFQPPRAGVQVLIPEAFTGAANAQRLAAARKQAESEAAEAVALLSEITGDTLRQASMLLETAARHLDEQTRVDL